MPPKATMHHHYFPNIQPDTRSLDEQYAAAKKEHANNKDLGPLRVFFGGDAGSQGDGMRAGWRKRFPELPIKLDISLSKYHDVRLDWANYNGESIADVVCLQTLADFPRWKEMDRLIYYKPPHFDDLLSEETDPDGAYLPVMVLSFGTFTFDGDKCSPSEVPDTFESLGDPKWKDRLILTYPNDDDAIAYLFSLIVNRYGMSWMHAVAANNVQWVRGTGTPVFELARQHKDPSSKRCLSFTCLGNVNEPWFKTKKPHPPEQIMAWPQTGALLDGTHQPETAKLFLSWLTSPEHQSAAGPQTILTSVNAANKTDMYNDKVISFTGFKKFEANRARVEWWKNIFEDILGTPQGDDPLKVYPNPDM